MIQGYRFGSFTLNGMAYRKDAIVHGDELTPWWRLAGHSVARQDIGTLVERHPAVIVIGTGALGMMKVPDDTRTFIEDSGIELIVERTPSAVRTFNRFQGEDKDVAIAMHLTC